MTLANYIKTNNINQIKSDYDFCNAEYEAIRDYFILYEVTKEDIEELEYRGYEESQFNNEA